MLQRHRCRHFQSVAQYIAGRNIMAPPSAIRKGTFVSKRRAFPEYGQIRLTHACIPQHQGSRYYFSAYGSQSCAEHTETGTRQHNIHATQRQFASRKNKKEVEYYIQQAHQHIDGTRHFHIARRTKHATSEIIQRQEWQRCHKHHEID